MGTEDRSVDLADSMETFGQLLDEQERIVTDLFGRMMSIASRLNPEYRSILYDYISDCLTTVGHIGKGLEHVSLIRVAQMAESFNQGLAEGKSNPDAQPIVPPSRASHT